MDSEGFRDRESSQDDLILSESVRMIRVNANAVTSVYGERRKRMNSAEAHDPVPWYEGVHMRKPDLHTLQPRRENNLMLCQADVVKHNAKHGIHSDLVE